MKIAVAGWSLHRRFEKGELKLIDFPVCVKEEFNVEGVELNSVFFESLDDEYLKKLKNEIDKNGMEVVHISVDGEGDFSSIDEVERKKAVENHMKWIYIAKKVSSPSFRANSGGHNGVTEETINMCVKSFTELCREAEKEGIYVLIENHGGISSDPDTIVRIMEEVGGNIGTCPDFGNFPEDIRYEGLKKISTYAKVVHAKFHEFDENGEDKKIDTKKAIDIMKDAGFDGYLSIEFEGEGDDHEGVLKSINLCKKYL